MTFLPTRQLIWRNTGIGYASNWQYAVATRFGLMTCPAIFVLNYYSVGS